MPWTTLCLKKGESEDADWYKQMRPEHKATARPDVFSMARGLCVNSKVLHEGRVCLSNRRQILRDAFVVIVLAVGPCYAFPLKLQSILYVCLCVPGHMEEQCVAVRCSPSLHMGLSPWSL